MLPEHFICQLSGAIRTSFRQYFQPKILVGHRRMIFGRKDLLEIIDTDFAILISIENLEGLLNPRLGKKLVFVERCRQKFCEVYFSIFVCVYGLH